MLPSLAKLEKIGTSTRHLTCTLEGENVHKASSLELVGLQTHVSTIALIGRLIWRGRGNCESIDYRGQCGQSGWNELKGLDA